MPLPARRDVLAGASVSLPLFEAGVLLAHLALGLFLRTVAWPEVTTPGYLWSRGMLLYRDVKFLHTPGLIGLLALAFRAFGPQTWVIRAMALAGPIVAHVFILKETRRLGLGARALISGFFVVAVFTMEGNAVWPTVLMSALALPIAGDLTRHRWFRAGLLIGAAILLKQTAAYLLFVVAGMLLFQRRWRALPAVAAGAALPYAAVLVSFFIAGAAGEMVLWTVLVPFRVQEVTFAPGLLTATMLVAAFLPTVAAAVLERTEGDPSASWLLAVAFGLALLCFPNFGPFQVVAALPCLAAGAARLLAIAPPRFSTIASFFLAAWTFSRPVVLAAGGQFDGKVLFWNEDPDFNALIARLDRFPPQTRIHSELWGNVLPRARRLPPGRVWVHPMLHWYFQVEHARERVLRAASEPGTVWVGYRSALPGGERIGGFAIRAVPAPPETAPAGRDSQHGKDEMKDTRGGALGTGR